MARGLVDLFLAGRRADPDRRMHRRTVGAAVRFNLEQLGLRDTSATVRTTLTAISLGSWRPGLDENAKRNAIPGWVVAWYRAGLV